MIKEINIEYNFTPFLSADYTQHTGSCITHQVHELQDVHDKFGGFPETYNNGNTIIHQLWWDRDQIDFDSLDRQLGMEVITVSSIKQPPGCVIPWHRDTFYKINQEYPSRTELKVRANIFLEPAKIGHFLQYEIDDELYTASKWEAGQGYMWDHNHLHLGANAGMQNKYTLQISGFLIN
jgi:hypothetical protein